MIYKNGIITDNGIDIGIPKSISNMMAGIDQNFGKYEFIDLVSGLAKVRGMVNGKPLQASVISKFVGLDTKIRSDPQYIQCISDITMIQNTNDITKNIIPLTLADIQSGKIIANNGYSKKIHNMTLYIKSPLPAVTSSSNIDIILPSNVSKYDIRSMNAEFLDTYGKLIPIADSDVSLGRISQNTLRLSYGKQVWAKGGYIYVIYK